MQPRQVCPLTQLVEWVDLLWFDDIQRSTRGGGIRDARPNCGQLAYLVYLLGGEKKADKKANKKADKKSEDKKELSPTEVLVAEANLYSVVHA